MPAIYLAWHLPSGTYLERLLVLDSAKKYLKTKSTYTLLLKAETRAADAQSAVRDTAGTVSKAALLELRSSSGIDGSQAHDNGDERREDLHCDCCLMLRMIN